MTLTSALQISENSLSSCLNEQQDLLVLAAKQSQERKNDQNLQTFDPEQCSDDRVERDFIKKQLAELRQQMAIAIEEKQNVAKQNVALKQRIDNIALTSANFEKQKNELVETLKIQKQDLLAPIYVKELYVTPRYCDSSSAKLCLEQILLLPRFSKAPVSDVAVTITDTNVRVVGESSYNPIYARVLTF